MNDSMTADERRAIIAASAKPDNLVLSPFFISEYIDICAPWDMFGIPPEGRKKVNTGGDFTNTRKIRDGIAALEKAADKHANRDPKKFNPVAFAVAVGDGALAHYVPATAGEAAPPTRGELDLIWEASKGAINTSAIKTSGEAQKMIARLIERDRLGLAKPGQLNFLLKLGMKPEQVMTMKAGQAGAIIGRTTAKWAAQRATG